MILASDFLLPHLGKLVLIWYQNGNTVINYFTWLYRQNVQCSHVESSQSSLICRHIPERYGRECEQTPGDGEGWGSLVCRSHGVAKSRTRLSDPTQQEEDMILDFPGGSVIRNLPAKQEMQV